jgi:hypothetical protein
MFLLVSALYAALPISVLTLPSLLFRIEATRTTF